MGRPPLPLGTWGTIRTYQQPAGNWRAMAQYKDYDGVTRQVERAGATKTKASTTLVEALRDRARKSSDGEITPDTKVGVVAKMYFAQLDRSDRATRTKQDYRGAWDRYLAKPLQALRVKDMRVSITNKVLTGVRDKNGSGAAKHARAVLTGMCALMVRHDALDDNPVREIEALGTKTGKKPRLVNPTTVGGVLGVFHASEDAHDWDLVDMQDVLSGLGCRIGELLALDWKTSVDFDAGTICFHGTVIRIKGDGLVVQDHTKSPAGMRTVRPAGWVMDILKRRFAESTSPWIFPSIRGTLRDPDNTRKYMRRVVAGTPYEGLHPHDWRHYVADVLERAGLSPREIADFLGHERVSTTQDVYFDRGIVGEAAGPALAARPTIEQPKNMG